MYILKQGLTYLVNEKKKIQGVTKLYTHYFHLHFDPTQTNFLKNNVRLAKKVISFSFIK